MASLSSTVIHTVRRDIQQRFKRTVIGRCGNKQPVQGQKLRPWRDRCARHSLYQRKQCTTLVIGEPESTSGQAVLQYSVCVELVNLCPGALVAPAIPYA